MAQFMTKLTGNDVFFVWSVDSELSFVKLKTMLISISVLALFESGEFYVVYTDVSGVGLGCVLM